MYKKYFFLLLILVVNGFSLYLKGMERDDEKKLKGEILNVYSPERTLVGYGSSDKVEIYRSIDRQKAKPLLTISSEEKVSHVKNDSSIHHIREYQSIENIEWLSNNMLKVYFACEIEYFGGRSLDYCLQLVERGYSTKIYRIKKIDD